MAFDQDAYHRGVNADSTANTHYRKPFIVDHSPHRAGAELQDRPNFFHGKQPGKRRGGHDKLPLRRRDTSLRSMGVAIFLNTLPKPGQFSPRLPRNGMTEERQVRCLFRADSDGATPGLLLFLGLFRPCLPCIVDRAILLQLTEREGGQPRGESQGRD
jgi:hypothetical protein